MALNKHFFDQMGLIKEVLTTTCNHTEPPWYGPVCQVVWEGEL
jgi:hypothetical protein